MSSSAAPDDALYTPIEARTAFDETFERLKTAIKLGLLAPGSRLPAERELCARFEISRSTLRQALTILAADGYLHATRGRGGGTFVADSPPTNSPSNTNHIGNWQSLCDQRMALELGIVALAARNASAEELGELTALATELESQDDFAQYCRDDRRLHIAIAGLMGEPNLMVQSARMQSAISDLLKVIDDHETAVALSNAQHRALVEQLRAGDERGAILTMFEHLGTTGTLIESAIRPRA